MNLKIIHAIKSTIDLWEGLDLSNSEGEYQEERDIALKLLHDLPSMLEKLERLETQNNIVKGLKHEYE